MMERIAPRRHRAFLFQFTNQRLLGAAILHVQLVGFTVAQPTSNASPVESASQSPDFAFAKSLPNDAALTDVFFVDGANGWAVGDRGVIWHTADGGATWHEQSSDTDCRLNSVFFVDAHRGWAAGGVSRPPGRSSQGVVLQTVDAGATWTQAPNLTLPLLNRIKFFDPNVGLALGACSAAHPSGVFVTRDGGRSWQPVPADKPGYWSAGDFLDAQAGAVAGAAGQFATFARHQVNHSPLAMPSLRAAHAVRLLAPNRGWLVGDGGLVMTTADLGHSWQSAAGELPENAAAHFDFHALAVHGPHVWLAGTPGTRVFTSADGGRTWQAISTGQLTPIRALCFVDAEHGWAVGDLGCILATRDGGRTWQPQRAGGRRAALLAVFASAAEVPLEALAEEGAAEGYLTAVELLHTEEADAWTNAAAAGDRARAAMILAGASSTETAWRFPLPLGDPALTPADLLAALNRANDGRAIQQLQKHLVRTLRMWRPDVVLIRHASQDESESMAAVMEHLLLHAVGAAHDPAQFTELANDAGLEPWGVKKVYGLLPAGAHGEESIATGRFVPWFGASLGDWTAPARRLLLTSHASPPDTYEFKLLFGERSAAGGPNGLFRGLMLARGSDARRAAPQMPPDDSEDLRRIATRRRHLQELLQRTEGSVAWAGQVATLLDGLDTRGGGELLFQLASGYRAAGRLDLAADTYYLLAQRYPEHPLADSALLWLVHFYASSEAAHRAAPPVVARTLAEDESAAKSEVLTAAFAAPAVGLSRDDRLRRATQLAEYLQAARPMLYADPALRFAEVAAQRQLGYANAAKRYFLSLGQRPVSDPWRRCGETEQWLAQPAQLPPPKLLATCRRTLDRPHLDGQLDEPFWEKSDRLPLRGGPDSERATPSFDQNDATDSADHAAGSSEVRLAYDSAFLYMAVRCPKAVSCGYDSDESPRPRDADLSTHDRATLRLDLDRDFTTAFELTFDHRGWTQDACWGDATWDPSWYVAAASDETSWTVEAAVPLAELTAEPPASKHVWAVAARRVIPRVGNESWAGPAADDDSPEQFGLLIFE